MNPTGKIVLGIDLGTTYCCIAYVNPYGKPEVIENSSNERTTPSVVWFDGNRVVVGSEAKAMAVVQPTEVASFVKRYMGDETFFVQCKLGRLRPEEISSYVLKKLVKDASEHLGQEIKDVVITCPAYFFIKEREATRKAGELAGLNVVEILNEPTAAAMAYGFQNSGAGEKNILVYDLGGGTFDVTMIKVQKDKIEVVCTGGDHRLGGKDWDDAIVMLLVQKFRDATGNYDDLLSQPEATQDLQLLAEATKKQLSQVAEASAKFTYAGETHRLTVTRAEFEAVTENLLEQTIGFTKSMLEDAQAKGIHRFDELLLVGGSTKMPQVMRRLKAEFNAEPKIYDPDEAVAKGAAIVGNNYIIRSALEEKVRQKTGDDDFSLDVETSGNEFALEAAKRELQDEGITPEAISGAMKIITNVASKSFGTLFVDPDDPTKQATRLFNLLYRNQKIPAVVESPCYTVVDNQPVVKFEVIENLEGEPTTPEQKRRGYDPSVGLCLWEGDLDLPNKNMPAGAELKVVFNMDKEGLLEATCMDCSSGKSLHTVIRTGAVLSREEEQDIKKRQAMLEVE